MTPPNTLKNLVIGDKSYKFFDLNELGADRVRKLPYSLRILVENLLRKWDSSIMNPRSLDEVLSGKDRTKNLFEIPYYPSRVLMQDFTGVPAVVDLAAMRDAVVTAGGDPRKINPLVPVDLVIDHSVQIDSSGNSKSLLINVEKEYERNQERYTFLKWAQKAFSNFRVVPPNSGICHQVNLEYLGQVVMESTTESGILHPDTLVGTDSHTTMINGLGIMGWGVGGIEAEAVMLGQPYYMPIPDVIAVKLTGKLSAGCTATDMVLTVTEMLRKYGVVDKFIEFVGPGVKHLTLPDRATIANMSPEYGATMGFFPVDEVTLDYLRFTGRDKEATVAEAYCRANLLFATPEDIPEYRVVLELDLGTVVPSMAGPNRPQDRLALAGTRTAFDKMLPADNKTLRSVEVEIDGEKVTLKEGAVVIASITSCTNTSNPAVMLGSALLAKKAVDKGLTIPKWVKTSLAPGSRAVQDYLEKSGLLPYLNKLGFDLVAFGCATCIGNSGPLHPAIEKAQSENNLALSAVLSGNRNFDGRVHPHVKAAFLASPLLCVAYALAGTVDVNLDSDPLGLGKDGKPVMLSDIWPTPQEIEDLIRQFVTRESYISRYKTVFDGDAYWKNLKAPSGDTYNWEPKSTYIQCPPYFENFTRHVPHKGDIRSAHCLLNLGDSITTDHISPAGNIRANYPAGLYLQEQGVKPIDFNSYGARRGNHLVMMRGTFANIRIKNALVAPKEGSYTLKFPGAKEQFVYDAAMTYINDKVPLVVLGGKEYGTGSSRDWAAKGTILLGVKAVLAQSFERIHRSNLVGMGVLPLVYLEGQNATTLGLTGHETFSLMNLSEITPGATLTLEVKGADGKVKSFQVRSRLDTEVDVLYFKNQGILPFVMRKILG